MENCVRDHQQITFVTFNWFCLLSKRLYLPPPLSLIDNIKLDSMRSKVKWKMHALYFALYFKLWSKQQWGTSYKNFKNVEDTATISLLIVYISFYISRYLFSKILELYTALPKKKIFFRHEFSFFKYYTSNRFTQTDKLKCQKFFCWCSLSVWTSPVGSY